uniref:Uncharacterized protein n=1 Tax=Vespula pensylvanica TaxID=30213 RepID=A0A834U4Y3_VESPE|nr:hypothetical protein H0235_011505 [Vespula pensylvanica]
MQFIEQPTNLIHVKSDLIALIKIDPILKKEGGTSVSVLQWIPNIDDDGKFLACRAENPKLPEAAIEDRWKLKVHSILYNEKNKFDYSDKFLKASKDKRGETYQAGLEFHSNASVFYTTIVLKQGSS